MYLPGEVTGNNIVIRKYEITYPNVGKNFDADSGLFTAPVDGVYVTSISLYLLKNVEVQVGVRYQGLHQISGIHVCLISSATKFTTACSVGVVDMKAGDKLLSVVIENDETSCDKMISFSCFLLR